jgi:D-alanyl-D-alanine carboxypeptidase
MRLEANALRALKKMFEAAGKDNLELVFFGGWRSEQAQRKFFDKKVNEVGYKAAVIAVSPPRASEHELGLAADILSVKHKTRDAGFGTTSTGKWLAANAWKYGFILRYPKNKTGVTGYKYEPWHYRFVGETHAKKITESGLCLEEYLD